MPAEVLLLWMSDSSKAKDGSTTTKSQKNVFSIESEERGHIVALLVHLNIPPPPKQRLWLPLVVQKLQICCLDSTSMQIPGHRSLEIKYAFLLGFHMLTRAKGTRIEATMILHCQKKLH